MMKSLIWQHFLQALSAASSELNGVETSAEVLQPLKLERPRQREHGHYAINVSALARWTKMPPPKIAETLQRHWPQTDMMTEVVAGFINIRLKDHVLAEALIRQVQGEAPGKNTTQQGENLLIEFVSANPTGPLHIGHGRWAALGDSIRRILIHCGAAVTSEFYINDAGVQMENITQSLWRRSLELLDPARFPFPQKTEDAPYPYYPGEYVITLAQAYLESPENRQAVKQASQAGGELPEPLKSAMRSFCRDEMLGQQKDLLSRFGVPFEVWYSEQDLHAQGRVEAAVRHLKENGYTFEQEGALWFKTTDFGDEKDRVLIKSDGSYTYLTADIAYHDDKFNRKDAQGNPLYTRIVNIWGADHHGYMARMRAAVQALGHPVDRFEILLGQLVNLIVEGEKTRMGKRRSMLTLEDVIEEVGPDATRFWMVSKSADTPLDFDVQLAKSASDENPVFYAQYAHARCASILRNAVAAQAQVETGEMAPPLVEAEALAAYQETVTPQVLAVLFDSLAQEADVRAKEALENLIARLDGFGDLVSDAARLRAPHLVSRYCLELAADFHSFYNVCRILTPDVTVTQARLMLIVAIKRVLAQGLYLLGVGAPESM